MKISFLDNPYLTVNGLFLVFIIAVMLYSRWLYDIPEEMRIKSNCQSKVFEDCKSYGLSRGFHHITHFRYDKALELNPYAIRIFLFFLVQFFLRIIISIFLFWKPGKYIVYGDAVLSGLHFMYAFIVLRL